MITEKTLRQINTMTYHIRWKMLETITQNKDDTSDEIRKKAGIGREFFYHMNKLIKNDLITVEKISVMRPRGKRKITTYHPTEKCLELKQYLEAL